GPSEASVHAKLVLHAAPGVSAVAEICALPADPATQRGADPATERRDFLRRELTRRPQRMDPGMPERLVGVDVAEAGNDALVENRRLHRGPPPGQPPREEGR